ncbi:MAG: helix-turn-helix domain-containing protein [Candidatus Lokiarchaeota archaeon]|nr:helix-turn-helix domain-containing protein [Candidatus Lokiarchaeota archaeon]
MEKSLMIEGLSRDEFREILTEVVGETFKQHNSPQEQNTTYLTREETKELLRISMPTLNEYTKQGVLKGYRIGCRVLYNREEVLASLKEISTIKHRRQA